MYTNSAIPATEVTKKSKTRPPGQVKGVETEKQLHKDRQLLEKTRFGKQAYSSKQGYADQIITNIVQEAQGIYEKAAKPSEILDPLDALGATVVQKFEPFYGKSAEKIKNELGLEVNENAKAYLAGHTNAVLDAVLGEKNEEFKKAAVRVKTIRLKENNLPKEDISLPNFRYKDLIESEWEGSGFKNTLESKFLFVFYQFDGDDLILKKVQFWNMPYLHILMAKKVWDDTVKNIKEGKIVSEITDKGIRKSFFSKKPDNAICHVRPHAKDKYDTYTLPIADKMTGLTEYTKHCFWLNGNYIRDEIYLK